MLIAILADVHANAFALEAVHADAERLEVESFWVLGDVIGYGPHPTICIQWLQTFVKAGCWVIGNHEAIFANLLGPDELAAVNQVAKTAIELNRQDISAKSDVGAFCQTCFTMEQANPISLTLNGRNHILVHSGQIDHLYRYIYAWDKEIYLPLEFESLQAEVINGLAPIQWFGHTHVPTLVRARSGNDGLFEIEPEWIEPERAYRLDDRIMLVNPGSVGQPRDGCRSAAYAILDSHAGTITFRRVAYDWTRTADDLNAAGYPDQLVARLRDAGQSSLTPPVWRDHFDAVARRFNCHVLR